MSQLRPPTRMVKDLDKLVKPLGWTWTKSPRGHVKYKGPDGKGMVIVSSSKGSSRDLQNILHDFRRQGCKV